MTGSGGDVDVAAVAKVHPHDEADAADIETDVRGLWPLVAFTDDGRAIALPCHLN